jgi:hypothetical protein
VDRDSWTFEFLNGLARELEPPLAVKFARALALSKWSTDGHRDPTVVVREWLKARPELAND